MSGVTKSWPTRWAAWVRRGFNPGNGLIACIPDHGFFVLCKCSEWGPWLGKWLLLSLGCLLLLYRQLNSARSMIVVSYLVTIILFWLCWQIVATLERKFQVAPSHDLATNGYKGLKESERHLCNNGFCIRKICLNIYPMARNAVYYGPKAVLIPDLTLISASSFPPLWIQRRWLCKSVLGSAIGSKFQREVRRCSQKQSTLYGVREIVNATKIENCVKAARAAYGYFGHEETCYMALVEPLHT